MFQFKGQPFQHDHWTYIDYLWSLNDERIVVSNSFKMLYFKMMCGVQGKRVASSDAQLPRLLTLFPKNVRFVFIKCYKTNFYAYTNVYAGRCRNVIIQVVFSTRRRWNIKNSKLWPDFTCFLKVLLLLRCS